jgi:hypothetical protein
MIFSNQHRNLVMVMVVLGAWCALRFPAAAQAPPPQPSPASEANRWRPRGLQLNAQGPSEHIPTR